MIYLKGDKMSYIEKFTQKPTSVITKEEFGRFERFNLIENPFPSQPFISMDAQDKRMNGSIYEAEIRKKEFLQFENNFLKVPRDKSNHLRLGYIIDKSFVGRGNGKSAYILNLIKKINENFTLKLSDGANKCFANYVTPLPGGRTKSFDNLIDLLYQSILTNDFINYCLANLRVKAVIEENSDFFEKHNFDDEKDLINKFIDENWLKSNLPNYLEIEKVIANNKIFDKWSDIYPITKNKNGLFTKFITINDFNDFYKSIKRTNEKLEYFFSYLVDFFKAADFNGVYFFIDDFQRIPDWQSASQKKDFAFELRSCLFDGLYSSAKYGFYNFILVLHAGVPRLIQESWTESGMENRSPINSSYPNNNSIMFDKLTKEHVKLLIRTYLLEYRINKESIDVLFPFSDDAIDRIAEITELNASRILQLSYSLLDKVSESTSQKIIDAKFINSFLKEYHPIEENKETNISKTETIDLMSKSQGDI